MANAPVLNIRPAQREGARLVISLSGISGSGKTLTALLLAYGMANGDGGKVGVIDTENRRGSLYADPKTYEMVRDALGMDRAPEPFLIGDLDAPFSPARYSDALMQFQAAGVDVVVIDSGSHEWEGIGGCEDIAERGAARGMKDWATAKREHKKFMNTLLTSNMHVIVCVREREKVKIAKDASGKTVVEPQGFQPICEKNFMFEMTASLRMWSEGKVQEPIKMPDGLRSILGRGDGYITAADGRSLRAWVDGAKQLDPEVEAARNHLRSISEKGMAAYKDAWPKLSKKVQRALVDDGSHESLKAAAEAFDKREADSKPGGAALAALNDELAAGDGDNAGAFK